MALMPRPMIMRFRNWTVFALPFSTRSQVGKTFQKPKVIHQYVVVKVSITESLTSGLSHSNTGISG
jgi:hypothetical protein